MFHILNTSFQCLRLTLANKQWILNSLSPSPVARGGNKTGQDILRNILHERFLTLIDTIFFCTVLQGYTNTRLLLSFSGLILGVQVSSFRKTFPLVLLLHTVNHTFSDCWIVQKWLLLRCFAFSLLLNSNCEMCSSCKKLLVIFWYWTWEALNWIDWTFQRWIACRCPSNQSLSYVKLKNLGPESL